LQAELGISLLQAGFLLSFVQLAGMSLGLVVGLMADRWGLRRSLLWGLVLLGVASVLGAWAHSVWALLGLRALEGLGFLLVTMPAPALIRRLVPVQRMSAMLGWWGTFMPLGAMLALLLGIGLALVGAWIEALSFLYQIAWFTGFIVAFLVYGLGMKQNLTSNPSEP
jgi:MFS family permease